MPKEFASTMRELAAAATVVRDTPPRVTPNPPDLIAAMMREFEGLNSSLQSIEAVLSARIEHVAQNLVPSRTQETQLAKIEEHFAAIRASETVNQKLFDSLHDELLKYRDNFIYESLQKPFVRDLLVLFDDLNTLSEQLRGAISKGGKTERIERWRDNLENAVHSLLEVLHRLEVTEVEAKEFVDLQLHKVVSFEPAEFAQDDGRIVMRVKRGFIWRGNVLRPEEVITKRY